MTMVLYRHRAKDDDPDDPDAEYQDTPKSKKSKPTSRKKTATTTPRKKVGTTTPRKQIGSTSSRKQVKSVSSRKKFGSASSRKQTGSASSKKPIGSTSSRKRTLKRVETVSRTPSPVVETSTPVVENPAPVAETPAPVAETPAPVVDTPQSSGVNRRSMVLEDGSVKNGKKGFESLPQNRRNQRLNRIKYIESAWGKNLGDCLPEEIRPRVQSKPYAKPRVQDGAELENDPRNWSDHFLNHLQTFSALTQGRLDEARDFLVEVVKNRQRLAPTVNKRCARHQFAAELIIGDLRRAIESAKASTGVAGLERKLQLIPAAKDDSQTAKGPQTPNTEGTGLRRKSDTMLAIEYCPSGSEPSDDEFAVPVRKRAKNIDQSTTLRSTSSPLPSQVLKVKKRALTTFDTPTPIGGNQSVLVDAGCNTFVHPVHAGAGEPNLTAGINPLLLTKDHGNNNLALVAPPRLCSFPYLSPPSALAEKATDGKAKNDGDRTNYDGLYAATPSRPTADPALGTPALVSSQSVQNSSFSTAVTSLSFLPGQSPTSKVTSELEHLRKLVAEAEATAAEHREKGSQMRQEAALEDYKCSKAITKADTYRRLIAEVHRKAGDPLP